MGFLDRLLGRSGDKSVLWLYVRCSRCGAKVRVRVNLFNDLSITENGGYILRKEILDNKCFQLMRAELRFDSKRRLISRDIDGGEFITEAEYEAPNPS
jgi:hypothetical protein